MPKKTEETQAVNPLTLLLKNDRRYRRLTVSGQPIHLEPFRYTYALPSTGGHISDSANVRTPPLPSQCNPSRTDRSVAYPGLSTSGFPRSGRSCGSRTVGCSRTGWRRSLHHRPGPSRIYASASHQRSPARISCNGRMDGGFSETNY